MLETIKTDFDLSTKGSFLSVNVVQKCSCLRGRELLLLDFFPCRPAEDRQQMVEEV